MDSVTFTDDFDVVDEIADYETPVSEPGEILLDESDAVVMQEVGEIQSDEVVIEPQIITYQNENNPVESDLIELDPVNIDEIPLINYDLESEEEKPEFDETNILVALSSIRDAVKSETAESIETDSDVLTYLKSIDSQAKYTNYLLAMLIGILVIKTVFDKVMP